MAGLTPTEVIVTISVVVAAALGIFYVLSRGRKK